MTVTAKDGYTQLIEERKKKAEKEKQDTLNEIEVAFEGLADEDGKVNAKEIAEQLGISYDTLKRWFGNSPKARKNYKAKFEMFSEGEGSFKKLFLKRKN